MTNNETSKTKTYPTFYLVMLIISSMVALSATSGAVGDLFTIARDFEITSGYTIFTLISLLGVITFDIATGLLWARHGLAGLKVITIGYALNLIGIIGSMFFSQHVIQYVINEASKDAQSVGEREIIATLAPFFVYAEYIIGIIIVITLAILWRVAVKKSQYT